MLCELLHVQMSNYDVLGAMYLAETLNNFWCSDGGQPMYAVNIVTIVHRTVSHSGIFSCISIVILQ